MKDDSRGLEQQTKEQLLESIDELIESTDSYKLLAIRIILISSLTLVGCFVAILLNNQEKIIERLLADTNNEAVVEDGVKSNNLVVRDILSLEWYLERLDYPSDLIIGIESLNEVGFRDILWLSNSNMFFERDAKSSHDLFSVLRSQVLYAKNNCIDTAKIAQSQNYAYYACPIKTTDQKVIGTVWINYDKSKYTSSDIAKLRVILDKIITQIEEINNKT